MTSIVGYCRQAAADIDALLHANPQLRLVLVPFPVLGIQSIQGTRVELAVARLAPAATFYKFHRMLDSARGVVDGNRAMAAAQAVGLDPAKVLQIANGDDLADIMKAHVRMGDAIGDPGDAWLRNQGRGDRRLSGTEGDGRHCEGSREVRRRVV